MSQDNGWVPPGATSKPDILFLLNDSFNLDASDSDYYLTGCPSGKGCSLQIRSSNGQDILYQYPASGTKSNIIKIGTKLSGCKLYLFVSKNRNIDFMGTNADPIAGIIITPMIRNYNKSGNNTTYEPYLAIAVQSVEVSNEQISIAGDIGPLLDQGEPFWASRAKLVHGGVVFDLVKGDDVSATWSQTGFFSSWATGIMCNTRNFIVDGNLVTWGGQSTVVANTTSYGKRAISTSLSVESYVSDCGSGQLSTDSMAIPEYIPIGDIRYNPNKTYFYYNETANAFLLEEEDLTDEATFYRLRNSLFEFNTNHYAVSGIIFDSIFTEIADSASTSYHVFLQKYGAGDCYPAKREAGGFRVIGTPGLSFAWEVKVKKKSASQGELVSNDVGSYDLSDRYAEMDYYNQYPYQG